MQVNVIIARKENKGKACQSVLFIFGGFQIGLSVKSSTFAST